MQPKVHYPAVYFVRHGQTAYNVENRWMGQIDQPLNQAGRRQVRELAEELRGLGIKEIISSPLKRALQSAETLQLHLAAGQVQPWAALAERALGELEGRIKIPEDREQLDRVRGVEPADLFGQRIMQIKSVFEQPRTTLIVSHSGVYRALIQNRVITAHPDKVNLLNAECVQIFPLTFG